MCNIKSDFIPGEADDVSGGVVVVDTKSHYTGKMKHSWFIEKYELWIV